MTLTWHGIVHQPLTSGRRNYRTFIGFVFGTTLLCLYVATICAFQIKIKHDALVKAGPLSRSLFSLT